VTDPLGNQTVTDLDGQGRSTDFTDKRNFETTYTYNKFGEVTQAFFNANNKSGYTQDKVNMSNYDALDRVGQVTDSVLGNTNTFTYDSLDSILKATDNYVTPAPTVSYAYDSNGRRISMTPSWEAAFEYGYDCGDELVGISNNGTWTPPNCSPSTFVNYNNNISASAQVAFNLDADGNAAAMLVDGVETLVTARDANERIKAESFQPYASPSPSYGGLTYTYDADGHVIDEGGTLAVVNIPPAASAAYSATDQITTWNTTSTNPDKASNIINDLDGLTFKWNPRNQLSTVSGGVAALFYYDGLGRRELSNATPPGAIQDFEYDGSSMIGWNTSGLSPSYNFLTIPGGAALAGSFTSGGTTTTWVPVVDASGSTLGLVNAASPQSGMVTTYTYDPSGTPSVNGTANEWPFQYNGMEKEFTDPAPYYYSGSGQFYSPQFVRSLSEAGQTSTGGSGGPPPTQLAYGPGSQGNGSFGHWLAKDEEGNLTYLAGSGTTVSISIDEDPYALPIVAAIRIVEEWVSFFEWLLGGGGAPPTPRQLLHGRHPLYLQIVGIQNGLVPTEGSSASDRGRPLAKNDDIEPASGPIAAFTTGLEVAETAEVLGGGPEDPAADIVAGTAIGAGIVVSTSIAVYKAYQAYQSGHDEDCDKEWEAARETCRELLSRRNPPRGLTGGYKNIEDCARGFVTEECGGNPVDYGR
jgi:YD repeat-containing protein